MQPHEPISVKLFCGVLTSSAEQLEQAFNLLTAQYSLIDWKSPVFPFTQTNYYVPEMGTPIDRLFITFRDLINPQQLARIKVECNDIETKLSLDGRRKVNLDPGYLDYDKVVLASAKYAGHKVYLDLGIYADITLMYRKGRFVPSDWCFPDFKTGEYDDVFLHIRAKYKGQLRKAGLTRPVA
ncbi:MAG: DUF4416 family protein [Calditrichaeota bacterium]|nr:MAG: DUF4416 family protein [Calditrichota bacterium]